jgi:hypothetical protein
MVMVLMVRSTHDAIGNSGASQWRRSSPPPLQQHLEVGRNITHSKSTTRRPTYYLHMRFPSFPSVLRAFHTVTNSTSTFLRSSPANTIGRTIYGTPQRAVLYRSMPNIPFLGALFGSSSSMADNTNYPVQKPEGEWQTQLSPGMSISTVHTTQDDDANQTQSNSVSYERKAPSHPALENTTNTIQTPACINAVAVTPLFTKQTTNSTLAADGPLSGTPSPVLSDRSRTLV